MATRPPEPPEPSAGTAAAEGVPPDATRGFAPFDDSDAPAGLRVHTARGVLINGAFSVFFAILVTLRRVLVAIFLTTEQFGLWGLIFIALNTLLLLKQVGIGDKYVQQRDLDQERAFHKAFTIEAMLTMGMFAIAVAALPLFAVLYDTWDIVLPALVLALTLPLSLLSFPLVVFYRRLEFTKQRLIGGVDPVVGLIATISLAVAGFGVWSLILGQLIAMIAGGLVTLHYSPYRLRFVYDRGTLRSYFSFSWPLMVNQGSTVATVQATAIAGKSAVGLSGLGAIGLAGNLSQLADGVDAIITRTMYPAICRVADRIDVLHEAFVKSNRLALMWGIPFGGGLALFASDLVDHVYGAEWEDAIGVITMTGISVAIGQVGYNWTAFMRARNDTRGIGVVAVAGLCVSLALTVPLLLIWGLEGFVWGMLARAVVLLALRGHYLRRMFRGFGLMRHMARSFVPVLPAAGAILALRLAEPGARALERSLGELALYGSIVAVATLLVERSLLREAIGYMRGEPAGPAGA